MGRLNAIGSCVRCGRGAGRGVVSMPRPGWGGGGGVKYGRACTGYSSGGVRLWGRLVSVDVDVVLVYRRTMIWDARVVVKGGFWGIRRRT